MFYRKKVTANEYLKHRLYRRDGTIPSDGTSQQCRPRQDTHLIHGKLSQEWMLSSYLNIEKERMDFYRFNQDKIKADQ